MADGSRNEGAIAINERSYDVARELLGDLYLAIDRPADALYAKRIATPTGRTTGK